MNELNVEARQSVIISGIEVTSDPLMLVCYWQSKDYEEEQCLAERKAMDECCEAAVSSVTQPSRPGSLPISIPGIRFISLLDLYCLLWNIQKMCFPLLLYFQVRGLHFSGFSNSGVTFKPTSRRSLSEFVKTLTSSPKVFRFTDRLH